MLKTALVEGTGHYPTKNNAIYNVVTFSGDPNHIELLHLTGSATVSGLILKFVRSSINPKYLPWTIFTNGNMKPKSIINERQKLNGFINLFIWQHMSFS